MQLDVVNSRTRRSARVDLRDEVFGGRVNTDLIWESVVRANAAERRGTHATKNRALVSGSGKKPWRQKGTGRARVGEIRNPLWRKGGTVFGPQPRSYDYTLPKKVERGALRAALAQKLQDGAAGRRRRADASARSRPRRRRDAEAARRRPARRCSSTSTPDEKLARSVRNIAGVRVRAEQPASTRARRRSNAARVVADARRAREAAGGARLITTDIMKLTDVIRRPLITEKTSILREDGRTIVFQVAPDANKIEIKRAVEQLLGSKVASVRTSIAHGKVKRQGRFAGRRSDWKKAYVKLREGEKMPEFLEGA